MDFPGTGYALMVNIFLTILVVTYLIDSILILSINKYKPNVKNRYYLLHKQHGHLKISVAKLIIILIIISEYHLFDGPYGANWGIIFAYAVIVIKLLIDYIRSSE